MSFPTTAAASVPHIGQALRYYGPYMNERLVYVQKISGDSATVIDIGEDVPRFSIVEVCRVCDISNKYGIGYYADQSLPDADPSDLLRWTRQAAERQASEKREREEAAAIDAARLAAGSKIAASLLYGAAACWVAERREDVSDSQTDYFASRTAEIVALAPSSSSRFSFSAARRAAARLKDSAHLEKSGKEAEHRERWSMGDGTYLGESRYSGWVVRLYRGPMWDSRLLRSLAVRHAMGELAK